MAEVLRSQALSAELWWFQFSSDVDIGSALGRQKYSFQGADETWLKVLQVYLGDTADSVFVKTSPATDQEYTATFTGFLDLSGDIIGDIIYSLMPRIMPAYPPAGIIDLSLDSEGWGARMRAATEYWEKLTGVSGFVGETEYPLTQSQENPSIYELDTSQLPEPVDELAIRPIVAPGHENDFTPDQIADLVVPVAAPRHPPEFTNLRLHNPQRPWDDTITIIDGIIVFGEAGGWLKYRGMELMIARLGDPEDLLPILPYYPPGANDPNSPNYDPEAPPDGSANPPWWAKPIPPEKRPFYPWERDKPPAVELLDPADLDPGFALPCPYAPPDRVMPPITIPFPLMNLSELGLPAGDHTLIARIYNEANDYSERTLPLHIEVPIEVPGIGPIDRVKDVITPVASHTEGESTVDHNIGNVIQGWAYLYNRSGETLSATLHVPQDGTTLDFAFAQESPGSDTWRTKLPDLDYPVFDSTLEFAIGGGAPSTMDYPLHEVSEELHFYLSIRDKNGDDPTEIDPAQMYELEGRVESRTPFSRFQLIVGYRSSGGEVKEEVILDCEFPASTSRWYVYAERPGHELSSATGGDRAEKRWIRAKVFNALGREVDSTERMDLPPPTSSGRSMAESVKYYIQEYLARGLVYGTDSDKPPNKRPFDWGKGKLEGIDHKWPNGVPDSAKVPDTEAFAGIDCSGLVYNVIDYVRIEHGLPSLDKVLGSDYTNSGQSLKNSKQFTELKEYYKPQAGAGATPDPGNIKVKDLKAGDFMYGKPYGGGHYIMVEEVVDNGDGTYDVLMAHSGRAAGPTGKNGPHEYTINDVDGDKGIHEIEESDIQVEPDGPSASYEKDVLEAMEVVRRDKDLAEEYRKEEESG